VRIPAGHRAGGMAEQRTDGGFSIPEV
jgi:hypothetical protein